jgi:hypothetical protein
MVRADLRAQIPREEQPMTRFRIRLVAAVSALSLWAVFFESASAQVPPLPIRMRAFAVNMTNVATGANGILEIIVDSWSTAAERERLLTTIVEKGQDKLVDELQKVPVKGRIRVPNWQGPDPNNYRLGWDLRYTWHEKLPDGGERIVIATDRYMSFWELRNQPRTVDYPFTLLQIHFPKEGKGEGRMALANQIKFDKKKNVMELEQYSAGDIRLNEITVEKK